MSNGNQDIERIRTKFGQQLRTSSGVILPEGSDILELEEPEESLELALDLGRKGASDALIRAVGGEDAVPKVRQILTHERVQRGGGGASAPPATG